MRTRYGDADLEYHCADTTDTLCYATNQNQNATRTVLGCGATLALVVGGYNSSNTSHLLEICSLAMPSYLIADHEELLDSCRVRHYDIEQRQTRTTEGWLPAHRPLRVVVTSGASCPDTLMNQVVERLVLLAGGDIEGIRSGLDDLSLLPVD